VGTALLKAAAIDLQRVRFTHRTPDGDALWRENSNARYVPHHFLKDG